MCETDLHCDVITFTVLPALHLLGDAAASHACMFEAGQCCENLTVVHARVAPVAGSMFPRMSQS